MASDRVERARRQDAAMASLDETVREAGPMIDDAYALLSEASKLRGDAMLAVRETGVSVKEIAAHLDISVQRAYQLLTEAKGRSRAATAS